MEKEIDVKVSEELVEETSELFRALGMTTTSAINIFLAACLREEGLPFEVRMNPFFDDCGCGYDCGCGCDCDDECHCGCDCGEECDCDDDCKCGCHCDDDCKCGCKD